MQAWLTAAQSGLALSDPLLWAPASPGACPLSQLRLPFSCLCVCKLSANPPSLPPSLPTDVLALISSLTLRVPECPKT